MPVRQLVHVELFGEQSMTYEAASGFDVLDHETVCWVAELFVTVNAGVLSRFVTAVTVFDQEDSPVLELALTR